MKSKTYFKILSVISILFLLFSFCGVYAATSNKKDVKLEVVEDNVCTIKINEYAKFEKRLLECNLEDKELTVGLRVVNTAEPVFDKPTEIFLVIDNSISMKENKVNSTDTRLKVVTESAKKLATELLKNENVKVGVVQFSTGEQEGTITDATLLTTATSDSSKVMSSISSIANSTLGIRTNIDAGLQVANKNFTSACESKYIILLTDGVPNAAVGGPILTYSDETATKTKATLDSITQSGVKLYSMMTGVENVDETSSGKTYKELAEEIFGTQEEPNYGKFYYIPDSKIEETVSKTILKDITVGIDSTLTNLKIYDYFPQEIVDNFDFSYVKKPTKGTISESIDLQTNSITWTIDKLAPGESAEVSYKLKLKDQVNDEILEKILKTNEKVQIKANEVPEPVESDVAPKIKITKPEVKQSSTVTTKYLEKGTNKEIAEKTVITGNVNDKYKTERKVVSGYKAAEPEPTNKEGVITNDPITVIYYYEKIADTTTAPETIPQTGESNTILLIAAVIAIPTIVFGIKTFKFKKIK